MKMTIKNFISEEEVDAMPERERVYKSETELQKSRKML